MARKLKKQCTPVNVGDWLDEDNLLLISGWTRDGYNFEDIAKKIGITRETFKEWRKEYPEFDEAMREGREITDYKVENALLKSALGYKTKESKITVIMRYGEVVEKQKETLTKEVAPNVTAIQTWLYNRLPEKWNRRNNTITDDLGDDESIKIEVTRAKVDNNEDQEGDNWSDTVNKSVTIKKNDKVDDAKDDWDDMDEKDEDYWPEDDEWEAMKASKKAKRS